MARVVCLDDYEAYARMVAIMLERYGHVVMTEIVPISLDAIVAFAPEVIVASVVRKLETISAGGMQDFYRDVEGGRALKQLSESLELRDIPLIITSIAVLESELPAEITRYQAFIEVPQKLEILHGAIEKIAAARQHGSQIMKE